jgi:hypothetical protein
MNTGRMGRIEVFCSYAREDEPWRARLEAWLAPLRAEALIDDWYDHRIEPGQHWNDEIGSALERARLMIFLVTPDLLASSYVQRVEIAKAVERERAGRCQVVPLMVRPADWQGSPLAAFQALPGGGLWIEQIDAAAAQRAVEGGLREVCRRIVDWSNPYRRASVGDWTHSEQTMTAPDGRSMTLGGTEEVIARTDRSVTVQIDLALPDRIDRRTVTIDLTQPYEQGMGDGMKQLGMNLPPDFEFSIGPAQFADEAINLGGRHYETVRSERSIRLGRPGQMMSGTVRLWRCIDVPLYGTVKGESDIPAFRQHQVLIDSGFGDAAQRKPHLQSGAGTRTSGPGGFPTGPGGPTPPPMPAFGPGRWLVQMNAFGAVSAFDMILHPNGMLQGQQMGVPMPVQHLGQWGFDPAQGLLTLMLQISQMGMPLGQETVMIRFQGAQGGAVFGQDMTGRLFQFQRTG